MSAFSHNNEQEQDPMLLEEGVDSKGENPTSSADAAPIGVSLSLAAAVRAHNKGKLDKAVQIYSSILKKYPNHADANYLLGVAAQERGLNEDALAMFYKAIECDPTNAAFFGKLGEILSAMGKSVEANAAYDKAAELAPDDVRFHLGRAQILERNGQIDAALEQYLNITQKWPESHEAHYRCAVLQARDNQRDLARKHVAIALDVKNDYSDAYFLSGLLAIGASDKPLAIKHLAKSSKNADLKSELHFKAANKLYQLNAYDEALDALNREVKHSPHSAPAYSLMGDCLLQKGEYEGAALSFGRAIDYDPLSAHSFARRALALLALGRQTDSLENARQAVKIAPKSSETLWTLGVVLRNDDALPEAIEVLSKAYASDPKAIDIIYELSAAYQDQLNLPKAKKLLRDGLSAFPQGHNLRNLLGQTEIQSGFWPQGWTNFEARRNLDDYTPLLTKAQVRNVGVEWQGQSLSGKRVLVYCDGCVSDTIQMVRFLKRFKGQGASVYLYCTKDLARVLASVEGIDSIIPKGSALPRVDFHLPLGSIVYKLGLVRKDMESELEPYITPVPKDVELWRDRLSASGQLKVGLVWQGDPAYEKDKRRSAGIWPFSRLFYMRHMDFYSLQVGQGREALSDPQLAKVVTDLGLDILDYADTAAVIDVLDLVITVDTSVAHLAGAMGKDVWCVVPHAMDWRWEVPSEIVNDGTLWYPTMKLFRQSEPGDWADVFAHVGLELNQLRDNAR